MQTEARIPAGHIRTALGTVLPDSGYARLLAALDEAHEGAGRATIRIAGVNAREWIVTTGDHVERDRSLHLGGDLAPVLQDSTIAGSIGLLAWVGGHVAGGSHFQRFSYDGIAMTVEWNTSALYVSRRAALLALSDILHHDVDDEALAALLTKEITDGGQSYRVEIDDRAPDTSEPLERIVDTVLMR